MDIVDRHFAAENAHDVAATLATYTDDIVWDDVTNPLSPVHAEAVGGLHRHHGCHPRRDFRVDPPLFSEDGSWVVGVSDVTGHVEGEWAGIAGGGAPRRDTDPPSLPVGCDGLIA